ncbi:GNAT family N-acetyltransferase [Variovorax sp. 770b2]|uniref:GNAT family N-acetyltransferase n=1 Tax=Variovorax sp. 770b2 TaxID=1566271 RepID=UPI0008F0375B|nr:GNAT family N-acetyltransferase [Variovorax sp. 770b2]SFP49404.1 Predicted acetyltransferase, GNAT family [Variovorax sp. 770b2]
MTKHPDENRLDNPPWFALATKQAHLGQRGELAARYHPDVAAFAGVANTTPEAFRQLGLLLAAGEHVLLTAVEPLPPVEGMHAERLFAVCQMVDTAEAASAPQEDVRRLGAVDAPAMLALALETKPGPFGTRTHEMGNYIGIRDGGRLVAMAGERMRFDGYTEISAVCVNDANRGKGIAGRLMNVLRREIRGRGETPFLHVRDDNATAIGLYERLGFRTRQTFHLYRVGFG